MRVPAFLAGGFTEKALKAAGTSPFVSNSLVHVTDLHATALRLASATYTNDASSTDATNG